MSDKRKMNIRMTFIVGMVLGVSVFGLGSGGNGWAETPNGSSLWDALPSPEKVEEYRKSAEQALLNEETRRKVLDLYDSILTILNQNKEIRSRIDSYRSLQESVPAEMEKVRRALSEIQQEESVPADGLSIMEMEKRLASAQLVLEEARKNSEQMQRQAASRIQRQSQIPEEIRTLREQIDSMKLTETVPVPLTQPADPSQAAALLQQCRLENLRLQVEALEEEAKAYSAAEPLMILQRDLASRRLAAAEQQYRLWEEAVRRARLHQTERVQAEAEEAARLAQGAHPVIRAVTVENAQLAQRQADRIRQIEQAAQYGLTIETRQKNLSKDLETIQTQVARVGHVTEALGVLLLTKKNDLPDLREHQKQIRRRMMESSAVQLEWSQYDRQWSELADLSGQAALRLSSAGLSESEPDYSDLLEKMVDLLGQQREILKTLTMYTMQYLSALAQLDIQERMLVSTIQNYQRFIEENIFWVKNTSWLSVHDVRSVVRVVREWVSPVRWRQIALAVRQDFRSEWGLHLLCLGGWLILFRSRGWMSRTLQTLARRVSDIHADRFLYTVYGFVLSVLLACVGPAALFYGGWRLQDNSALFPETASFSAALMTSSVYWFIYRFLRIFCSPEGLGVHFRLPADSLKTFRRHISWLFRIWIPLVLAWCLTEDASIEEADRNAFLRFLFLGQQILLMVFLLILLRPSGAFLSPYLHRSRRLYSFRYVWYGFCWLVPLFFCYLSISGYGFTAQRLYLRLLNTLLFLLGLLFVHGLLLRWLSRLRETLPAPSVEEPPPTEASGNTACDSRGTRSESGQERFVHLFFQTRKLINALTLLLTAVGIFWIWRDVLPAFGVLEKVSLWRSLDAEGRPMMITLASLFRAVIIGILTVILTRNLPGFLEVSILRRFPFDAGVRFAITTLSRYGLVIVGVLLISSQLGIRWSSVQWLIAALGVGLGFGLQEVFANFVCGLLLLFERPLRVGDVITTGDVTGRVTRIQIRATTIQLWDRKELVVPNREFITGRLINWTLSDTVLRLVFPVGVAYGSDIKKVEQVLYRIAASNPHVIQDNPKPQVVFDGFGDSALQFELRVYIASMDFLLDVKHQMNCAIDEEFRKEGIEIPFPQRDLHIRSIQASVPIVHPEPTQRS